MVKDSTHLFYFYRLCDVKNLTTNILKNEFGFEEEGNQHSERISRADARETCKKTGRYWKYAFNSKDGLKQDFQLARNGSAITLTPLSNGIVVTGQDFCVVEKSDGSIDAQACLLPCMGRKPCLR